MIDNDRTFLSSIIVVLFFAISVYLGIAARRLSVLGREFNATIRDLAVTQDQSEANTTTSWLSEHLKILTTQSNLSGNNQEAMHDRLVERIHRGHAIGWFTSDALIRLGLIGTVIGFILMLGAVYQLKDEDVSVLQDLLGSMGEGMQVALYTTLTGISCSLAIAIYCKCLDRYADNLISHVVFYLAADQQNQNTEGSQ
ncbi:MAG: MotA/TolQ/ExbB proton channel family protein [Acidiferrobacterales bacterium]|nr:MotA/TolQ/ExbB proton channel family protein [Acidiferrobacterales bacterium]